MTEFLFLVDLLKVHVNVCPLTAVFLLQVMACVRQKLNIQLLILSSRWPIRARQSGKQHVIRILFFPVGCYFCTEPLNGGLLSQQSACQTPQFQRVLLNIVIQFLYCPGLLLSLQSMCNVLWSESSVYPRPPGAVKEPVKSWGTGAGYAIPSAALSTPLRLQGAESLHTWPWRCNRTDNGITMFMAFFRWWWWAVVATVLVWQWAVAFTHAMRVWTWSNVLFLLMWPKYDPYKYAVDFALFTWLILPFLK